MTRHIGISVPHRRVEDDDDIQEYKRPWVGLTDAEIEDCFDDEHLVHARNIERLLKEKNT